jgi:hypothetical protein
MDHFLISGGMVKGLEEIDEEEVQWILENIHAEK